MDDRTFMDIALRVGRGAATIDDQLALLTEVERLRELLDNTQAATAAIEAPEEPVVEAPRGC